MLKKIFVIAVLVLLAACGQKEDKQKTEVADAKDVVVEMQLDSLLGHMDNYIDKKVSFTGTIVHTCQHGGKRAHVVGTDKEMKLKLETAGNVPKFNKEMEGNEVVAEGVVKELIIDKAYLDKWEAEIKAEGESKNELHEGHQEGHDGMSEREENLAKVKAYRQQLEESGKEKLEFYWVDLTNYKLKEAK